jgi:hypothetical protein
VTLGDIGTGLLRYRPFVALAGTIVLIAVVLPGHDTKSGTPVAAGNAPPVVSAGGAAREAETTTPADAAALAAGGGAVGVGGRVARGASALTSGATSGAGAQWDQNCDLARGRIRIPDLAAPPCVPVWNGVNGGATWQGVTKDTITIVHYIPKVDAATQAVLTAAGISDDQAAINQDYEDWATFWQKHAQLYGRKVKLIHFTGTAAPTDDAAGKADAVKIAKEIKAFMVWGSNNDAFVNELVADKVICVCTTTLPSEYYQARAPYVWGNGLPDEDQAYEMRAEMIGRQIAFENGKPAKAKFAGDPPLALRDRSFGLIWFNTGQNAYGPGEKFFEQQLAKYNVHLADQASYVFDPNTAQQTSDNIMARFASENITSVIFVGDPIYPVFYTEAASRQNYHPEWIVTGSALTDTNVFGRVYDKSQWKNAFGLSLLTARVPLKVGTPWTLYTWHFHKDPPAPNTNAVIYVPPAVAFTGIQGAGPVLNPQTFKQAMFSYPPSPIGGQNITVPLVSWGRAIWGYDDYNVSDDSTLVWWDNTAQGPDELDHQGVGMYRFVDMGKRYLPGRFPTVPFRAFDNTNTITIYGERPPQDRPPDYGPAKDAY